MRKCFAVLKRGSSFFEVKPGSLLHNFVLKNTQSLEVRTLDTSDDMCGRNAFIRIRLRLGKKKCLNSLTFV